MNDKSGIGQVLPSQQETWPRHLECHPPGLEKEKDPRLLPRNVLTEERSKSCLFLALFCINCEKLFLVTMILIFQGFPGSY